MNHPFKRIKTCIKEFPDRMHKAVQYFLIGQTKILKLAEETGKIIDNDGIYWYSPYEKIPSTDYVINTFPSGSKLCMRLEVSDDDIDQITLDALRDIVKDVKEIDTSFPNIRDELLPTMLMIAKSFADD